MQLNVLSTTQTSTTQVSDVVFGATKSPVLLAQAVRVYLARLRQGTSKTKTRSEINRSHKKWFKQKGTGNARHGARTPSIFVGGGVSHGPNGEQNWSLDLSPRMKNQALMVALSHQGENCSILKDMTSDAKALRSLIASIQPNEEKVLVIIPESNVEFIKKIRNMHNVMICTAKRVTALDVVQANKVVVVEDAVAALEARVSTEAPAAAEKKTTRTRKAKTETVKKAK